MVTISIFLSLCLSQNPFAKSSAIGKDSLLLQKADSLYELADQFFQANDTTSTFQYLDSALHIYISLKDSAKQSNVLNDYGYYHYYLGDFNKSLRYYQQALSIDQKVQDTVKMIGRFNNIGIVYQEKGMDINALKYYNEALRLAKHIHKEKSIAFINNSIAILLYEEKKYDKANTYFRNALRVWNSLADTLRVAYAFNNLGLLHYAKAQYDSALYYYQKALHLKTSLEDKQSTASTLQNLGETYIALDELPEAKNYLEQSYTIKQALGDKYGLAVTSNSLAKLYLLQKGYAQAKHYLDTGNLLIQQINSRNVLLDYLSLQAQWYEANEDFAEALAYHKQWAALRDSLFNEERLKVFELESEYELQEKEQARQLAEQQVSLAQAQHEQQRIYTARAAVGLGIVTLISLLLYRLYRINRHLSQRNALLVREQHHRVKNNLQAISSLLSLQSRRLTDERAKKAMLDSQLRVQSMVLIHRRLYGQQLTQIKIQDYLTELVTHVLESFSCHATPHFDLGDIQLDVDQAVPVGLIVNEVVSNACKHAFPDHPHPELYVGFHQAKALGYELIIQDNGPGFEVQPSGSFGMKLIQLQARQLNGRAKFIQQQGTLFQLNFSN